MKLNRSGRSVLALSVALASPVALANAASVRQETFVANGPGGITGGDSSALFADGRVTGAIQAIVPHPTNSNVLWVGAANGGVWKTSNALSVDPVGPTWTPLTDHMPGLSITSLEMDPMDSSHDTLVAGVGSSSSFLGLSGKLTGILRTTDGGDTWTALGSADLTDQSVRDVAPRGATIVVVAANRVWRSTDTGNSFHELSGDGASGLPDGSTFDLAGDPSDADRLYTGVVGTGGGVYTSSDRGQTWQARGGGTFGGASATDVLASADQVQLSVHADPGAGTNAVYAAVLESGLTHMFRSEDHGQHWEEIDAPADVIASGRSLMALVADPAHAHVVYLSGREVNLGPEDYYRCNTTKPAGSQCTLISGSGTANNTRPHVDSRDMEFDSAGNLLEADDGGLYLRAAPDSTSGDWFSIIGNLATTEDHSCAYDHLSHVGLCGTQDIGTPEQPDQGAVAWIEVQDDDGGSVSIADWDVVSTRYYSAWPGAAQLLRFTRATCISGNFCIRVEPALTVAGTGQSLTELDVDPGIGEFPYVPIAAGQVPDATHPQRLAIATRDMIYESLDGGENLSIISGLLGKAYSIAYGGRGGGADKPDVLYVGTDQGLFLRSGAGSSVTQTAYPAVVARGIGLDPSNWESVWVNSDGAIRHSTDQGGTWTIVTGDLATAGAEHFRSVRMIPGADASVVVIGASDGVYATDADNPGRWARLSGDLPNAVAYNLDYDASDDVLLIGTMGRSTWLLPSASAINRRPLADPGGAYTTLEGQDIVLDGSGSSDPDGAKGDSVVAYDWDLDGDGVFGTSGATPTYDSVGQDGTFTVTLQASDQLGALKTASTTVTVQNVAPTLTVTPPDPVVEDAPVTVKGQLTDPGWKDPLTVTIDFGSGPTSVPGHYTSTPHGLAKLTFSAEHVYGDNGTFPVQVCGSDDDTTVCATVNVVVNNVKPNAHIDPSTLPVVNGTVIAHAGDVLHFRGISFDPGSDDRLTRWDFDDGTVVATTSFNNGASPDPPSSPEVNPRTVVDQKAHVFTACLYTVRFSAADDDGGLSPVDAISVVIQGNADRAQDNGFWKKQYDGTGHADFDAATLDCYLAVANYMSRVFSEVRNAADPPSAFLVLKPDPQTDPKIQDFDRELLAAWLNFANGGVNLTESVVVNGHTTLTFEDEMAQAETLRLDPATTKQDLDTHKAILEKFNHFKR